MSALHRLLVEHVHENEGDICSEYTPDCISPGKITILCEACYLLAYFERQCLLLLRGFST
jgi:hypothetical protein